MRILSQQDQREEQGQGSQEVDEYPPCPECGDPIDYCQGHGTIG